MTTSICQLKHGKSLLFLCSDNLENVEYLHDNSISLMLPLKYGVNVNVHGWDNKLLSTTMTTAITAAAALVMQDYCFLDCFAFPYPKV